MLIDFKEIPPDGDQWEAFARDFLVEQGFAIDHPPNRGADGGKDLIVTENLRGHLGRYLFRWLVSCKHKAHSKKSVTERDEPDVLERVRSFNCDGFLGIYSTLPSTGLVERLRALRNNSSIRDYKLIDRGLIENQLLTAGYSPVVLRHFPSSYQRVKPLHAVTGKYVALTCRSCGRDMLDAVGLESYSGLVGFAYKRNLRPSQPAANEHILDVYWACKGACDEALEQSFHTKGVGVGWEDISDLTIPSWYLRWVLTIIERLRCGTDRYAPKAHKNLTIFITALGQKVFREVTAAERKRVKTLLEIQHL